MFPLDGIPVSLTDQTLLKPYPDSIRRSSRASAHASQDDVRERTELTAFERAIAFIGIFQSMD
jgi:hypothetical protein